MWRLWEKKYAEAVREVEQFQKDYPDHNLLAKAREVMDRALQKKVYFGFIAVRNKSTVKHS